MPRRYAEPVYDLGAEDEELPERHHLDWAHYRRDTLQLDLSSPIDDVMTAAGQRPIQSQWERNHPVGQDTLQPGHAYHRVQPHYISPSSAGPGDPEQHQRPQYQPKYPLPIEFQKIFDCALDWHVRGLIEKWNDDQRQALSSQETRHKAWHTIECQRLVAEAKAEKEKELKQLADSHQQQTNIQQEEVEALRIKESELQKQLKSAMDKDSANQTALEQLKLRQTELDAEQESSNHLLATRDQEIRELKQRLADEQEQHQVTQGKLEAYRDWSAQAPEYLDSVDQGSRHRMSEELVSPLERRSVSRVPPKRTTDDSGEESSRKRPKTEAGRSYSRTARISETPETEGAQPLEQSSRHHQTRTAQSETSRSSTFTCPDDDTTRTTHQKGHPNGMDINPHQGTHFGEHSRSIPVAISTEGPEEGEITEPPSSDLIVSTIPTFTFSSSSTGDPSSPCSSSRTQPSLSISTTSTAPTSICPDPLDHPDEDTIVVRTNHPFPSAQSRLRTPSSPHPPPTPISASTIRSFIYPCWLNCPRQDSELVKSLTDFFDHTTLPIRDVVKRIDEYCELYGGRDGLEPCFFTWLAGNDVGPRVETESNVVCTNCNGGQGEEEGKPCYYVWFMKDVDVGINPLEDLQGGTVVKCGKRARWMLQKWTAKGMRNGSGWGSPT